MRLSVQENEQLIDGAIPWKEQKMTEQEVLSPQQLEQRWAEHLKGEFDSKDVEATLATMADDAYVNAPPASSRRLFAFPE